MRDDHPAINSDPFVIVQDYPPERLAHDAAVAIQDAIDECEFRHYDKYVLETAKKILEDRANDL